MSLDISLLRLLKYREKYDKLARAVPEKAVDTHTRTILHDFGRYFREMPDVARVEAGPFMLWFKMIHPNLTPEACSLIGAVMTHTEEDVEPGVEEGLMARLVAAEAAYNVADLLTRWNNGDEVDLYSGLRSHMENFEVNLNRKVKNTQVLTPIEELLAREENDTGLHWRLPTLNRHIKPLVGGDFVVIAARPDKGKTTFCSSELTYMAAQVDKLYPGEKRSILWFNNEGPGERIITRNFQAAIGATTEELVAYSHQPADAGQEHYKTQVRQRYAQALGGRPGVLRVMDIHGMWNHEVEDIIAQHNPALCLFDMVDNIRFGGGTMNNGERTDQLLEAMYQWARLLGVKYNCPVLATSQISAEGDGLQYPTLGQLKDSRTGKQGAADVIITLGAVNDPSLVKSRYIGTTKNKKVRTGVPASPCTEVYFDSDRGRYKEYQA